MYKLDDIVKKNVHLRIDERMLNELKSLADEEGRGISEMIREAIADLLRARKQSVRFVNEKGEQVYFVNEKGEKIKFFKD